MTQCQCWQCSHSHPLAAGQSGLQRGTRGHWGQPRPRQWQPQLSSSTLHRWYLVSCIYISDSITTTNILLLFKWEFGKLDSIYCLFRRTFDFDLLLPNSPPQWQCSGNCHVLGTVHHLGLEGPYLVARVWPTATGRHASDGSLVYIVCDRRVQY